MRKLLIILLTIGFSSFSFAQFNVYHHFPDSNAIWGETFYNGSCGCGVETKGYNFVVKGDTIVNGLKHHKVYENFGYDISNCCNDAFGIWDGSTYFYAAFREDTMKHVYVCCTHDLGPHDSLLYDFNLKVGDTLKQYNAQSFIINSIDSVLVSGSYRKRFNIKRDTIILPVSIIEGIGSTQGLFDKIVDPFEIFSNLNCFSQNGKTIWPYPVTDSCGLYYSGIPTLEQNKPVITVYPNPSNGVFTFKITSDNYQPIKAIEVYNVLGEKVYTTYQITKSSTYQIDLSAQPNGIYFYRITGENENLIGEGKLVIQK